MNNIDESIEQIKSYVSNKIKYFIQQLKILRKKKTIFIKKKKKI